MSLLSRKKAVLIDIEGTTSSKRFVVEVLFPYARRALPGFLAENEDDARVAGLIAEVRQHMGSERSSLSEVGAELQRWIDEDRKITALKALQGLVWEDGYRRGEFKAHVYPDAHEYLSLWKRRGGSLYVYSSGSIHAQKLFFGHSVFGDLTGLFSGYFDTTSGPKKEAASYHTIAEALGLAGRDILFLSDVEAELDAAREAGMDTVHVVRPEEDTAASTRHLCIASFAELTF